MEVIPRSHRNCTREIPAILNGTEIFVDPISYVITSVGSPVHCNDVASLRYKLGGKVYSVHYCSYPELSECHDPAMLPVDKVLIESLWMNDLGFG
jgi:hypothetical protein